MTGYLATYTDAMEFSDVVRKRRMVRHFTPESVPDERIDRIVSLAPRAPSAGFSQGVPSQSLKRGRRRLEDVLHRERW